jgi:methylmalonyl-CoA mutase
LESLTAELAQAAWALIEEVESYGGMAKAIEEGLPKMRIEEAAARKQARIDSGAEVIVGVNKYLAPEPTPLEILSIDNTAVRQKQIERLERIKATRDTEKVNAALAALTECAASGKGNLLELAVEAARHRATLGEISLAMEKVFGRYREKTRTIAGVYQKEVEQTDDFQKARALADKFAELDGRRPRILIAKLGQDGHDRGAKIIASSFADIGFDVDVGPLFQTPEEAARQAMENDVHFVGVSSLAGAHKSLVPELIAALKTYEREDIMVIVGGVIPPQDYEALYAAGVSAVFGPGTPIAAAAIEILSRVFEKHGIR